MQLPRGGQINSVCIRSCLYCETHHLDCQSAASCECKDVDSGSRVSSCYFFCGLKTLWAPSLFPSCHGSNPASAAMLATFFAKPASCSLFRSKMYLGCTVTHIYNLNAKMPITSHFYLLQTVLNIELKYVSDTKYLLHNKQITQQTHCTLSDCIVTMVTSPVTI